MKQRLRWFEFLTINAYWLGINIASGVITPLLLPFLVVQFMPPEEKNTYLALVRATGLAVAMLVQPLAGMLSDRSTSRWGRRRPFIVVGTVLNVLFLLVVAASPSFVGSDLDNLLQPALGITTAYGVLLAGIVLLQVSSNISHGALQGLIPDVVPEDQRGRASGVKAVFELVPVFLVIFIGPLVDAGRVVLTVGIIIAGFVITMLVTVGTVREQRVTAKPAGGIAERVWRLVALTVIFVGVTRLAVFLVAAAGNAMQARDAALALQVGVVGLAGLLGMAGSILIGVYIGARVGIGRGAAAQSSFIWWVINRLLFLAAVGSIQAFAQFFLTDVLQIENAATMTTFLLAAVAVFLIPSALGGGYLADRIGRKRLVGIAGLVAAGGTLLLLFSGNIPMVLISGCIIGLGTGTFMATNWALGTDLVPPEDAGRYLGISNLAGAGAGIVGAGIGGPMADFFNALQPGLGYLVIFALYGVLFLLSTVTLVKVKLAPVA
jgi:MFS family permease